MAVPERPDAAKLYAEGLQKLRNFDPFGAREPLERAVAADPEFPLAHLALSETWLELGYADRAKVAAEKAHKLSGKLSREDSLRLEGRWREAADQWTEAAEVYRTLFGFFPDNLDYGLRLGEAQIQRGQLEEAAKTLETLRGMPSPESDSPNIDLLEADLADARGDYPTLQAATERAAKKAKDQGSSVIEATALTLEAWALTFLNQPDRALEAAQRAMTLSTEIGDRLGVADALEAIHPILSQKGEHAKAADQALEASRIALALGNKSRAIEAMNNAIFDLLTMGHVKDARQVFDRIASIGPEPEDRANVLQVDYLRGWLNGEEGDLSAALIGLRKSLADWSDSGHQRKMAATHRRLADVLLARGDLDEARTHYETAMKITEELRLDWYIAQYRQAMAAFEQEAGRPQEAERLGNLALEALNRVGAVERQADVLATLGLAALDFGRKADAQQFMARALELAPKVDNIRVEARVASAALRTTGDAGSVERAEQALADATRHGAAFSAFQLRLALGEHEMQSGQTSAGRTRLDDLARDAAARGFGLFAKRLRQAVASSHKKAEELRRRDGRG